MNEKARTTGVLYAGLYELYYMYKLYYIYKLSYMYELSYII